MRIFALRRGFSLILLGQKSSLHAQDGSTRGELPGVARLLARSSAPRLPPLAWPLLVTSVGLGQSMLAFLV